MASLDRPWLLEHSPTVLWLQPGELHPVSLGYEPGDLLSVPAAVAEDRVTAAAVTRPPEVYAAQSSSVAAASFAEPLRGW